MNFTKISLIIFLLTSISLSGCKKNQYNLTGNIFGTIYYINFSSSNRIDIGRIKENINFLLANIDNVASNYKDNSEIAFLNNSNDQSFVTISSNLYNLIKKSLYVGNLTNGYFDITLDDIKKSRGFYFNKGNTYPKNINRNFTYKNIVLGDNNSIKKTSPNIKIDLSGIANGYAVDLIYNYLMSKNIKDFTINIGGEIKVNSNEDEILIAIDDLSKNQPYLEQVLIKNHAIASSGTYLDTIIYKGAEISHIIDPKTLKNISNLNILVSVIHKECAIADALATGLIAMSKNDIIRYSNQNNIASMLVIKDGNNMKKYYSSSFKKFLKD